MKSLMERAVPVKVRVEVPIPALEGEGVQERVPVEVNALKDPVSGEIYYGDEALEEMDRVKARHMGLLLPEDIRELRESLDLSQRAMSRLLQIGEKTYTRWESGRDRPSRSLNILLQALEDGKVTPAYLASLQQRNFNWRQHMNWQDAQAHYARVRQPFVVPAAIEPPGEPDCASISAAA